MKVYFNGGQYDGCYYVRCLLPLIHNGWDGDRVSQRGKRKEPITVMQAMLASDIIVMQRPYEKARMEMFNLLKEAGKKIVFDNDDTYKVNDVMKLGKTLDIVSENIDWFVEHSDMVTTTTNFLANEYKELNPNTIVLPNFIDTTDWGKNAKNKTGKYRVGLVGSVGSTNDFTHVKEQLTELSKDDRIQLVLFSLPRKDDPIAEKYAEEFAFWESIGVELHPFVHSYEYPEKLASLALDLMIIPREDSYFNRAKSNLKFLEASMLKIPVLGQGFKDGLSPYQQDPHIKVVFDNWYEEVIYAVEHQAEMKQIGEDAHRYVKEKYDIIDNAHLWVDAFNTL